MDIGLLQVDSVILQVGGVNKWIEPLIQVYSSTGGWRCDRCIKLFLQVGTALLQLGGGVTGA